MDQTIARKIRIANAMAGVRHVFVSDLEISAVLGIHPHEKIQAQRILVNIDLSVSEDGGPHNDDLSGVVCYAQIIDNVEEIVATGHVHLVETLADLMAAKCLEDPRVLAVRVRIEKPDAIANARGVGVEIERTRTSSG